jgi:Ni,Fe-hydrogenase III small subunit/NAD-dependent dihydropyrimidine dehydrogenase PreA subunit
MGIFTDRMTNDKETIKDPLYENQYSFGMMAIDDAKCDGCNKCIEACIVGAISGQNGKNDSKRNDNKGKNKAKISPIEKLGTGNITIDDKKCIYCGKCIDCCGKNAISMSHNYKMAELVKAGEELREKIYKKFKRSLVLRSVDTGSCNACMMEMAATQNTYYDISRFGIKFAASPRHADAIVVTGPVAINMKEALVRTYNAMPEPKIVIALGACAHNGGIFKDAYGNYEELDKIIPVDLVIPGCPPSPQAIVYGLLKVMDRVE